MKSIITLIIVTIFFLQHTTGQIDATHIIEHKVRIMTMDDSIYRGSITGSNDSSLTLGIKNLTASSTARFEKFNYSNLGEIRFETKKKIGMGILIGSIGGAVIGGLVGLAFKDEPNQDANSAKWNMGPDAVTAGIVIGGLIGGTTGGLIGASLHKTFIIQGKKESYNTMRRKMNLY